jgi:hypothetical protein
LRCPPPPADIVAESRAGPVIAGGTGLEVSGRLVSQLHRKNAALKRALAVYKACRNT